MKMYRKVIITLHLGAVGAMGTCCQIFLIRVAPGYVATRGVIILLLYSFLLLFFLVPGEMR